MKKLIVVLLLSVICGNSYAFVLSDNMLKFRQACLQLREGLAKHDKYILMDASEAFKAIETVPFEEYELLSQSPQKALGKPIMQFNDSYCDELVKNGFNLIELDDLTAMRGAMELQTLGASIAAGGKVSFKSSGCENCSLMVVSEDNRKLKVTLTANGVEQPVVSENDGTVNWVNWTLPEELTEFSFTVENPSDKTVSFVIAVE